MISAEARPYIDASVPVLREHGSTITQSFYSSMFAAHPELTNLFNMGNQASGAQQNSLAAAVFAYAANIGNPGALGPVVSRIVHKHVSVGIRAEHYPIVGRHLLGAIQKTLGDAATAPLLSAWDEAYGALARLLIDTERKLYADAGVSPGELRDMRVIEVVRESDDVRSYLLQPLDGKPVPPFKPGQYVSVRADLGNGRQQLRQYSLSDAPASDRLRISVKREQGDAAAPAGEVSNWIHRNIERNSILAISHPFGDFTPDSESDQPVVLLSAGVGITPMISVLNRIAQAHPSRRVVFGHAARSEALHAHRADIAAARKCMPNLSVVSFYESTDDEADGVHEGRMEFGKLPAWPLEETDVYLCGPIGFMQAQWRALIEAGVPAHRLHREVFGPELLDHLL
ncbi:NO-inducible flavohemoprotein [Noviherbaspirillum aerium]|uniref:NO-inducible flavohemoprotein n=1 Tax=Noviherbaspirillum aerium TaxID=2588497 RepID=UPI00124CD4EB|nr:NO-inducible flavohemoprotein [Noviherbaspirillum aerium]